MIADISDLSERTERSDLGGETIIQVKVTRELGSRKPIPGAIRVGAIDARVLGVLRIVEARAGARFETGEQHHGDEPTCPAFASGASRSGAILAEVSLADPRDRPPVISDWDGLEALVAGLNFLRR